MAVPYKCQNLKFSTVTKFPIMELWEKGREPLPWLPWRRNTPNVIKGICTFQNKGKMEAAMNYKHKGGKQIYCTHESFLLIGILRTMSNKNQTRSKLLEKLTACPISTAKRIDLGSPSHKNEGAGCKGSFSSFWGIGNKSHISLELPPSPVSLYSLSFFCFFLHLFLFFPGSSLTIFTQEQPFLKAYNYKVFSLEEKVENSTSSQETKNGKGAT